MPPVRVMGHLLPSRMPDCCRAECPTSHAITAEQTRYRLWQCVDSCRAIPSERATATGSHSCKPAERSAPAGARAGRLIYVTMTTTTRIARRAVGPRPRSRPPLWRRPRHRRGYRRPRADTRRRLPKGVLTFWTRARRLLWSWWPWASCASGRSEMPGGAGQSVRVRWRMVSYLIAPAARPHDSVLITSSRSTRRNSLGRSLAPAGVRSSMATVSSC